MVLRFSSKLNANISRNNINYKSRGTSFQNSNSNTFIPALINIVQNRIPIRKFIIKIRTIDEIFRLDFI